MDFGKPVTVTRQVLRVLADRKQVYEDVPSSDPTRQAAWVSQRLAGHAPLYRAVLGFQKRARYDHPVHSEYQGWDAWPGIGISEEDAPRPRRKGLAPGERKPYDVAPASDSVHWVRFRRIELPEPLQGLVVGVVNLQEGHAVPGSNAGWDGDPDPPYFSQERRVSLLEVAIETSGRARLMLCWRDDVS